jgi:hypothetical protein
MAKYNEKAAAARMRRCFFHCPRKGRETCNVLAEQQDQDDDEDNGADADIHSESFSC